uniref:Integrase catalytic domain-containing protein n=1 Tax=Plectus sambesii TaxID=2011161 RepID=A0A914V113_9BILA
MGEDLNQDSLVTQVLEKLPDDIVLEVGKGKSRNDAWEMGRLRAALEEIVCNREELLRIKKYSKSEHPKTAQPFKPMRNMHAATNAFGILTGEEELNDGEDETVMALTTEPKRSGKPSPRSGKLFPCAFCGESHYNDLCVKYNTLRARQGKVKEKGLCFQCLRSGHVTAECRITRPCAYCRGSHNRALCARQLQQKIGNPSSEQPITQKTSTTNGEKTTSNKPINAHALVEEIEYEEESQGEMEENVMLETSIATQGKQQAAQRKNQVVLLMAKTEVCNPAEQESAQMAHIFFDSGSQRSFITQRLAEKLKLKVQREENLSVFTFAAKKPQQLKAPLVQFGVTFKDGTVKIIQASALEMLTNKLQRQALKSEDLQLFKQFSSNDMADELTSKNEAVVPDILIGSDYFWEFLEPKEKIKCPSGLYLIPSKVGLLIGGKREVERMSEDVDIYTLLTPTEDNWSFNQKNEEAKAPITSVEEFWSLESIGIKDSPETKDDDLALQQLNETIEFENGRYNVKWPWKSECPQLPDNYWLCHGRLKSLMRRFSREAELLKKYDDIIQDQFAKEIIEKVGEETETGPIQHYLPHHPVITPMKTTTKVRIVYDASAKVKKDSNSLNDCLYRGPVMLPDLCGLLLRFRKDPIAMTADIEKAFLQIGLQSADRDVTRFLWLKDPTKPFSSDNIQIYRFCRVTFGVISSPFLLSGTLQYHLQKNGSERALSLEENIYVDNVLTGAQTVEEARQFYDETKEIFSQALMNLREWTSNSKEFREYVAEDDKLKETKTKVLGLLWDTEEDNLKISLSAGLAGASQVTKRGVLQTIASTFDPLGLLAPVMLKGKIFFQHLWSEKYEWDDPLPENLAVSWKEMMEDWEQNPNFFIPRQISPNTEDARYQLLTFVDASKNAYAAVVYIRVESENSTHTRLLFSKNRLAPKKEISLPRLELLAALIGVRAMKFVAEQIKLPMEKKVIWSDSQCVLHWIQSAKPLLTFVRNRVKEIRAEEDIHFRYISTHENPADISTRGTKAKRFNEANMWWYGPEWLNKAAENWPEWNMSEVQPDMLKEINGEIKGSKFFHEATLAVNEAKEELQPLIDATRISTWPKLLRVTNYCLKFLKQKIWNKLSQETKVKMELKLKMLSQLKENGEINSHNIDIAIVFNLRQIQQRHFLDVHQAIKLKQKNQLIDQLGVGMDKEGILRCYGRLVNADVQESAKQPALLPRKDYVTQLIIMDRHQAALHSGVRHTLTLMRQEFWIPKGRAEVQKTVKNCLICRKYSAGPYSLPKMPPLPKERVMQARPFQNTGLDYLGPLWIKIQDEKKKVWICLFTCMVTRAIHLETIMDLTAEQFLNCVRRFIARKGKPDKIISDNAPHFKLIQKTIDLAWSAILKNENNINYFAQRKIEWYFITEYAPWQGGFYERLVGVVKQALRKTMGRQCLKFEQFYTLLPEVEAVVNSRPLTFIYDDFKSRQILRPIDFLLPEGEIGIPPLEEDRKNDEYLPPGLDSRYKMLQMWKKSLKNLDKFWELWYDEYLLSLRERTQTTHKEARIHAKILPKIDEIVLIKEEGAPRGTWQLGKIIELKEGKNKAVRSAKVQLANKSIINRPINLLYPLELSEGGARQDAIVNAVATKEKQKEIERRQDESPTNTEKNDRKMRWKPPTNFFYMISALMIIFGVILTGAKGNPCPEDAHLDKIQSQKCVKEGIVIMRTEQGYLCWIKKKCPLGHLGDDGACGPLCACPKWAEECSYHDGSPPATSGDQVSILNLAKPSACSFEPDTRCNEKPTHARLHQIQLYNGSLHYVKNLELRRAQATKEDYECQGEGRQVGTPEFCDNHECARSGTRFCYYRNNEMVFFINEDGEIPIKAWGSVPVTIYGPKEIPAENPSCLECTLKCVQGGIEIITDEKMGLIETCSKPYCYRISHPKRTEVVLFPKDIVINTHEVTVKIWSNGYLIKDLGTWCDASPYCEMIDCYLCWNLIGNPQCAPKWMFFIISLMLYFGSVTLYVIIKLIKYLFQCCYYSTYFTWQCLRCCRVACRRARSKTYEKMYLPVYSMLQEEATENQEEEQGHEMKLLIKKKNKPRNNNTFTPGTKITILNIATIIILTANQVKTAEACAEVTTLTAQQSMCTKQENGIMECILTEATRLALVPQGQDSCLLIKDPNGQPIGTLSIEVEKVTLECQAKNEYFTRSFTMKVESSKRCAGSGSCIEKRCGEVRIDSKVNELGEEANNSPGFTYCTESCGGLSCGCFLGVSGCLFYRTYASPTSDTTYEVFSCPAWEYKVKSTIRLNLQNENVQQVFEMKPGVAVTWKNIKLTLISVTSPPVPILGSQFLTDGTKTVVVKASAGSQPVSGTVGELQCANREKAEKFDCYLPHDACSCQGQETRVSCHCTERTIEDLFKKTEYVLPLTTYGLALTGTGKKIEAEYNQIASLELQVSLEGLRLSTKTDKNKCQINPLEMAGCYNCLTGAKLKFECKTDFGEALAHVTCGEGSFSTVCAPQGIKATATMNFQHAVVKELCTVVCPAGSTTFSIDTTLVFIEKERLGQLSNVISTPNDKNELDFGFLSAWLSGNWLASILLIAAVAVGILLSVIFFPIIMQILISCVTKTLVVLTTGLGGKKQRRSVKEL